MKANFNRSFYVCKVVTGDYRHRREKARNVRTTAGQYAVALPVSHRGGQSSIPGQSMWDSMREKSRKWTGFLSTLPFSPISIIPPNALY
jgi:transposase